MLMLRVCKEAMSSGEMCVMSGPRKMRSVRTCFGVVLEMMGQPPISRKFGREDREWKGGVGSFKGVVFV